MDLHKTTLETVEIAINTQAQIVNDLVSTNPGERSQAANGAAALLDKMVSLKATEDSREVNQIKAEIEEKKISVEYEKIAVDRLQAQVDEKKIETQERIEMKKLEVEHERISLERDKFEFEKEARSRTLDAEDRKAEAAVRTADAAMDRVKTEYDAIRFKCDSDYRIARLESNWKKYLIEGAKVVTPFVLGLISMHVWQQTIGDVMEFEESGKLTTTAFKLLKLPKLPGF